MIRRLLFILLVSSLALQAQTLSVIRNQGPRANRINLVILAEGYTAAQSSQFTTDATAAINAFVTDETFARFSNYVNGFAIFVASAESGADIPATSTLKNTYFNASFGTTVDRALTVDNAKVLNVLTNLLPDWDIALVLVNSPRYGGTGGQIAVVSMHPDSLLVALHEVGHSFAHLGDEYVDEASAPFFPLPPNYPNITQATSREQISWKAFLAPTKVLPTVTGVDDNDVGLFEGAYYRATGCYRPTVNSRMRTLGGHMGPVNLRAFADAVHKLNLEGATQRPALTAEPASKSVALGAVQTLSVTATGTGPLTYQWVKDGVYIGGATDTSLTLPAMSATVSGLYTVEVTNAAGTTRSTGASIYLASEAVAPSIQSGPTDSAFEAGDTATLTVTATGVPIPTYQWQKGTDDIPGATQATLVLQPAKTSDTGFYRVMVTNPSGTVASDYANLLVAAQPVITTHPQSQVLRSGGTLTAAATSDQTLTFEWRHNGQLLEGVSGTTLNFPAVTDDAEGWYSAYISDGIRGFDTKAAYLKVQPAAYPAALKPRVDFAPRFENRLVAVNTILTFPDGSFVAGGLFDLVDGREQSGLVRFDAAGAVDTSFVPPVFDGPIQAIGLQNDGRLVVGGRFQRVNGGAFAYAVRLEANGALDASYTPSLEGPVAALVVLSDNSTIVGGAFPKGLTRLKADGQTEPSFEVSFSGLNGNVRALVHLADGRIIAGGDFTGFLEANAPEPGRVTSLDENGVIGDVFIPGVGFDGPVLSLAEGPAGRIYAAGYFSVYNGVARPGIACLKGDASLNTDFDPRNVFLAGPTLLTGVAVKPDGHVVVCGAYQRTPTVSINTPAQLTTAGALDPSWTPFATPLAGPSTAVASDATGNILLGSPNGVAKVTDSGTLDVGVSAMLAQHGVVRSITKMPGGWVVGGSFTHVDGLQRNHLAKIQWDGTVDPVFAASSTAGTDGTILSLFPTVDGDLLVGGSFTSLEGFPSQYLALVSDTGDAITNFDFALNGQVNAVSVEPTGKWLIGGAFSSFRGSYRPGLLRLSTDATLDTTFSSGFGTINVGAVLPLVDGRILIGGSFSSYGGITRHNLALLSSTGALDSAFDASHGTDAVVRALPFPVENDVTVVGDFQTAGVLTRGGISKFTTDGTVDPGFAAVAGSNGQVWCAAPQTDGAVVVGGSFDQLGGGTVHNLGRLAADGTLDATFSVAGQTATTFTSPVYQVDYTADGSLLVAGGWTTFGAYSGYGLTLLEPATVPEPVVVHPASEPVTAGGATQLTSAISRIMPVSYQWYQNGVAVAGATSATLALPCAQTYQSGTYTLVATTANGKTVASAPVTLSVAATPTSDARLVNLSTRAETGTGDSILIPGFVLQGSGTKKLLIRGVGPTLGVFNVPNALSDPMITVVDMNTGAGLFSNDDWGLNADPAAIATAAASSGAFGLTDGSTDAALLVDLPAGRYTVPTSGKNGGTGIGLVEVYEADPTSTSKIINLSNRGYVGVGSQVMIPGLAISKEGPRTVLLRAVGPSLAVFNVGNLLADPVLTIFRDTTPLLQNDDWEASPGAELTRTTTPSVGAFALQTGSKDAAMVVTLPPGSYTVQATGKDGSTGVALVEVYLVP